jgi:hypothetical protein
MQKEQMKILYETQAKQLELLQRIEKLLKKPHNKEDESH